MLVAADSSSDPVGIDCEFVYFLDYKVDLYSFGCFDNNRGNFDGLDNVAVVR